MPNSMKISLAALLITSLPAGAALAAGARPANGAYWPACTSSDQWFCVAAATENGTAFPVGDGVNSLSSALAINVEFSNDTTISVSVQGGTLFSFYPASELGAKIHAVLQLGDFKPGLVNGQADQFTHSFSGDATAGYVYQLDATATTIAWDFTTGFTCDSTGCGDLTTVGAYAAPYLEVAINASSGNFPSGIYVTGNAQYLASPQFRADGVYLSLANPHLLADGGSASGSYEFWIPPDWLQTLGLSVDQASDGGLLATRFDVAGDAGINLADAGDLADAGPDSGVLISTLSPTFTEEDGGEAGVGVRMRIDSISYSRPTLRVSNKSAGSGQTSGGGTSGGSSGCSVGGGSFGLLAMLALAFIYRRSRRS